MKLFLKGLFCSFSAIMLSAGLLLAAEPVRPATKAQTISEAPRTDEVMAATARRQLIDINTAGEAELKSLPGLDDNSIARLILNRPYANKSQLVSRKVLTESVYEKIRPAIIAKQPKKDVSKAAK